MKKILIIICIWFLLLFTLTAETSKNVIKLKFATLAPISSSWGKTLINFRRAVYRATEKQIVIDISAGGIQGDELTIAKKLEFGSLDGAAFTGNGLGYVCFESRVLEVPFLFKNKKEVDYLYKNFNKYFDEFYQKRGYKLITLSETGGAYFFSKKKIESISDVTKTKMWMWKGDKLATIMMEGFGIPAIPIDFLSVISALQTGYVNGFYCTPTAAISLQWDKEVKYVLDYQLAVVSGGIVMSLKSWNKLKENYKKKIIKIADKKTKQLIEINRLNDSNSFDLLKKQGLIFLSNQSKQDIENQKTIRDNVAKLMINKKLIQQKTYDMVLSHLKNIRLNPNLLSE